MTTNSYPALGKGGLTEAQWADMYAGDDGIVEDYSGLACVLSRAGDTCTISAGKVRINGYTLDITAAHDLSTPPVSTGTKTYLIAAQYDPALNVADGSSNRSALGPCRLIIADTTLDTTGSKQYVLLYSVTRSASQALASAAVVDYRRWVGPVVSLPDYAGNPTGFGPFPVGTVMIQTDTNGAAGSVELSRRGLNAAGTGSQWLSVTAPAAQAFPFASGLVANDIAPEMYREMGGLVNLRGTLKRSSGNLNNGSAVVLGSLPVGWRPEVTQRITTAAFAPGTSNGFPVIVAVGASGTVSMYDTGSTNIAFISLDNIRFRAAL